MGIYSFNRYINLSDGNSLLSKIYLFHFLPTRFSILWNENKDIAQYKEAFPVVYSFLSKKRLTRIPMKFCLCRYHWNVIEKKMLMLHNMWIIQQERYLLFKTFGHQWTTLNLLHIDNSMLNIYTIIKCQLK